MLRYIPPMPFLYKTAAIGMWQGFLFLFTSMQSPDTFLIVVLLSETR